MSIRAINWVIEAFVDVDPKRVTPTMRHILTILANFAGDEDSSYPRQNTIARITGYSRACVNKNLKLMEAIGLISAEQRVRPDGSTRSSEYTLHIDSSLNLYDGPVPAEEEGVNDDDTGGVNDDDRGGNQDDRGDSSDDTGRQPGRQTGVNQDDTINHHLKPPPEPKARTKRAKKVVALPEGSDFPVDEDFGFEVFWKKYPINTGSKKKARETWVSIAVAGKIKHAEIMEGLEFYLNKDDFREWCMAQTWLSQERWEERPKQKKTSGMWAGIKGKRVTAI